MWRKHGRWKSDGLVCVGQSKELPGSFVERCHWWYEKDGVAYTEMFSVLSQKYGIFELTVAEMADRMENVRKYTSDEYQWSVDITESFEHDRLSHLKRILLLEAIRKDKPQLPLTIDYVRSMMHLIGT
jgi:hypothetical protein